MEPSLQGLHVQSDFRPTGAIRLSPLPGSCRQGDQHPQGYNGIARGALHETGVPPAALDMRGVWVKGLGVRNEQHRICGDHFAHYRVRISFYWVLCFWFSHQLE